MAMWKTCLILAVCFLAFAALTEAAGSKQDSESGSASESGGEAGSGHPSGSKSSKPSGAPGLQFGNVWLTLASLVGAAVFAPLSRLALQ